ncbi:hypothetical protein BDW66DRAFT_169013 [Aspergillus desertorum]
MTPSKMLGQVPSLFPHVNPEWWEEAYNQDYLWADRDCRGSHSSRAKSPCQSLLFHFATGACARPVLRTGPAHNQSGEAIPSVQFMGVDYGTYLISIAQKRAQEAQEAREIRTCNILFQVGDARHIPAVDGTYDVVILLGNSFGHGPEARGRNSTSTGWEWLGQESHFLSDPDAREKQLVVLRERELSPDSKIVHQDRFYAVQLYDVHEMAGLLRSAGLCKQTYESRPTTVSSRHSQRALVVAVKPGPLDPQDVDTYIHPSLVQDYDPHKGRLIRMIAPQSPLSSAAAARLGSMRALSNNCFQDVVWCNDHCKAAGQAHHDFEYAWLKRHGTRIRQDEGEDDLATLWIIMGILAGRQIESDLKTASKLRDQTSIPYLWSNRFKRGYQAIEAMRGNQDAWPHERIARWTDQIQNTLATSCRVSNDTFGLYRGATGPPDCLQGQQRGAHYGHACYPRATPCNYSCVSNLKHGPDEQGRMVLTATRDIAADEECCIAQQRTGDLFTFSCTCERCLREGADGPSI